jgi:hypothetical protein
MPSLNASIRDIPLPFNMQALPIDARGFPVPWFVAWRKDTRQPDFRVIGPGRREKALKEQRCWVCGLKLGRLKVTVIGPMCAVNKVSSEPPSHLECGRYAAKACPFLANPRMRRNEKNAVDERWIPGDHIDRNPGVAALWISLYPSKPFPDGKGSYLLDLGPVDRVEWYAYGRSATYDEVVTSIATGLPALAKLANAEGQEAVDALGKAMVETAKLLPPDPALEGV